MARAPRSARPTRWGVRVHTAGVSCALAWMLICAVAISPLLSRMHQVLHHGHGVASVTATASSADEGVSSAERSALNRLFGQHAEGSPMCQWLDHSGNAEGAASPVLVSLLNLPALSVRMLWSSPCAMGAWAVFQARGPPAFL